MLGKWYLKRGVKSNKFPGISKSRAFRSKTKCSITCCHEFGFDGSETIFSLTFVYISSLTSKTV